MNTNNNIINNNTINNDYSNNDSDKKDININSTDNIKDNDNNQFLRYELFKGNNLFLCR